MSLHAPNRADTVDTCHFSTKVVNKILFHQKHVLIAVN